MLGDEKKDELDSKIFLREVQGLDLAEAKKRFRYLIDTERNETRKSILERFEGDVERARDSKEVVRIHEKAVQAAEAETNALDESKEAEEASRAARKQTAQILIAAWVVGIVLALVAIITGFKEVHYYKMPDGTMVETDAYEGQSRTVGREKMKITYSHTERVFRKQPVARSITLIVILMACLFTTFSVSSGKESS